MTRHVMLDLETFGLGPTAAIVQIGAIWFDLTDADLAAAPTFQRTVSLQSAILAGLSVDQSTIEWWRTQSEAAKRSISESASSLDGVLEEFAEWLPRDDLALWSHGASFDVPILECAYRQLGRPVPWNHRAPRDTRTIFWLAEELAAWVKPKHDTAHTALADAIDQAGDVVSAYRALSKRANWAPAPAAHERADDVR